MASAQKVNTTQNLYERYNTATEELTGDLRLMTDAEAKDYNDTLRHQDSDSRWILAHQEDR